MGTERKRKLSLFDVVDETSVSKITRSSGWGVVVDPVNINGSINGTINRWNGRPYSQRYYDILDKRKTLPVWQLKEEFLKVLSSDQVVLFGETGCGKTTQIPQFVMETSEIETPDKDRKMMIAYTQPRRVAAMSVSRRVADEMDVTIGEEAFPGLCSDSNLIQFNRQLKRCDYDLVAWRKSVEPRAGPDLRRGFELLDLDGGIGWEHKSSMV